MNTPELETNRLILRKFSQADLPALFKILGDEDANTFLPWFSLRTAEETAKFCRERFLEPFAVVCIERLKGNREIL